MNADLYLIIFLTPGDWILIGALVCFVVCAFLFMDRLLRKGVYDEETGRTSNLGSAISNLQTMFDPAHRHVAEERETKRAERDDSGEPPETPPEALIGHR
jgi:hypothetical protein